MGREVQLESEMVQEKRARLDEKNSMVEKLTKAEKQLEQEKTKAMQSSREMEDIKESMKTQQLINMEMKDYERAVNELKNQLELKTNESNSAVQGKHLWFPVQKIPGKPRRTGLLIMNLDGKQLQELLDQVRQRATAAEEALEAAEERSEKYRAMIDEANIELNQFKEKVCFHDHSSDQSRFWNLGHFINDYSRNTKRKVKSNCPPQLASNCALKLRK